MNSGLNIAIVVVNSMIMVAVGMALEPSHFGPLLRKRRTLPAGLIAQAMALPVIGWVVVRAIGLPPHLAAGILLIAACPIGDIANFYTSIARANAALSLVLNTLSCLLAAATMKVAFQFYVHLSGEPFMFATPPAKLIVTVLLLTAAPTATGMILRRFAGKLVARFMPLLEQACVIVVLLIILAVINAQADRIATDWKQATAASLLLMSLAILAGWLIATTLRLDAADRITFAIVFPVRNAALAMTIAVTVLGHTEYAAFAVVYFCTEVPLLLSLVAVRRWNMARRQKTEETVRCAT